MSIKITRWLERLSFTEDNEVWTLDIKGNNVMVDMKSESIIYPDEIKIGRETTTNFSSEENFVVLDVVIGLLSQGYSPQNIEIEKGYRLGHVEKSGNADITVHNNLGKTFMIIEAKTFGTEFESEWGKTVRHGGQLFSYERQENTAEILVLYASRLKEQGIERMYNAISLIDNMTFLNTLDEPKSYLTARGGNDKFEVWSQTYQYDYINNGVLEKDIEPFTINKSKRTVNDLSEITHEEVSAKYNEFASILRKYNIGGKENAFDKLVNLFLTKIVDEEQNRDDLQFNWKGVAQDTYFELVDRLQKLYQIGMEKFLGENVTYVSESDVERAFRLREDAAKESVLDYFRQLKYFSNTDFSFIEVYNEKLFYQNSNVLVDIIKAFQDIKLKTNTQNQFLGDLFEGFLDNGIKQTEGQYFTPLPIVKFIIQSLPIKEINEQDDIPKVIDYACGAGHFLNEYANVLSEYIPESRLSEYMSSIYGVEKEYRLSKVAKVSSLMYGQDEINIIYNDGLKSNNLIEDNSYSVVIANPPYSVRGFLSTLPRTDKAKYQLSKYVSDENTNSNIELFFIERTAQLLKSKGIAAIILPSSILTNEYTLTNQTRKLILENFNIIAISELGSNTFGSTGTNTVTLFLQKREYPPNEATHFKYIVKRWFENKADPDDEKIIEEYVNQLSIEFEDYKELQNYQIEKLLNYELFKDYETDFAKTEYAKRINRKRVTSKYSLEDKKNEYNNEFIRYVISIENEKVYYYALARNQNVVIIKSPVKLAEIQKFLGYKWSKRRGREGIVYLGVDIDDEDLEVNKNRALQSLDTPLFNPLEENDASKISTLIKNSFNSIVNEIPVDLEDYVSTNELTNMLEFNNTSFNAKINTIPVVKLLVDSIYPVAKLGAIVNVTIGGTPSRTNNSYFTGDNLWLSIREMNKRVITDTTEKITEQAINESNVKLIPEGTTLLSFKLTIGKVAIAGTDLYTNEAIAGLIPINKDEILDSYLYVLFASQLINLESVGSKAFGKSLNTTYLRNDIRIPVPPIEIQEEISNEVDKIINTDNNLTEEMVEAIQALLYEKEIIKEVREF